MKLPTRPETFACHPAEVAGDGFFPVHEPHISANEYPHNQMKSIQIGDLKITLTGGKIPELCVSDTGVGISEENLPHIFSRFYTVDKSHNGTGGGFGLGLAIVRKLCTRAGWKLSVESRLGEGTTFKIRFFPPKIL